MKSLPNSPIRVARVDYGNPADCSALVMLLDAYACDPMGGGEPLAAAVKERLCADLARQPGAASFLAWNATGEAVGLINCFLGFSTFAAKPLLNIHDVVVHAAQRRQGIGQALLYWAEQRARELGCCKLTLEILSGNSLAMASYVRAGYAPYVLDPAAGQALLMQKLLPES